jgi:hypothetical protein
VGGAEPVIPGDYQSIQTFTVGVGGTSTISFSDIPSTYSHLQLRAQIRTNRAAYGDYFNVNFNSDTGSNYTGHYLYGNGTNALAGSNGASITTAYLIGSTAASSSANTFAPNVVDILDYSNSNKYKTARSLFGVENNGTGDQNVNLYSALWMNTNAISSITIASGTSSTIQQYSHFALYGIK